MTVAGVAGIDTERLALALEQFLLSLTSYKSKFDLAMRGMSVLTDQEKRGFELFFTEYEPRAKQFGADCFHCHGGALFTNHGFANNGLDETFADTGFGTLEEVVDHYDHGLQRSATLDPNLAKHPQAGLGLRAEDMKALVAFLKTLTEKL